eukprot:jgi/Bigna1/89052/estExt_fgenesh1_pg.C_430020
MSGTSANPLSLSWRLFAVTVLATLLGGGDSIVEAAKVTTGSGCRSFIGRSHCRRQSFSLHKHSRGDGTVISSPQASTSSAVQALHHPHFSKGGGSSEQPVLCNNHFQQQKTEWRGRPSGFSSSGTLALVDKERSRRQYIDDDDLQGTSGAGRRRIPGLGSIVGGGRRRRSVKRKAISAAVASAFAPIGSIFEAASVATVVGGALSGGLHAISGPDHIAALLPRCVGQRWWKAGRIALIWGSGHGFSTIVLGMIMWSIKDRLTSGLDGTFLPDLSRWTEAAVGFSLVLIGIIGLREAAQWNDEELLKEEMDQAAAAQNGTLTANAALSSSSSSSSPASDSTTPTPTSSSSKGKFQNGAIFVNGLLHGCSLDGLQTLAPALALASWRSAVVFVVAHYVGTAVSMAIATAAVGEGSLRVGRALKKPEIVRSLSRGSSAVAILVGAVFAGRSVFGAA